MGGTVYLNLMIPVAIQLMCNINHLAGLMYGQLLVRHARSN